MAPKGKKKKKKKDNVNHSFGLILEVKLTLVEIHRELMLLSLILPQIFTPTPVFLPGESQGRGSLLGCCL